MRQILAVTLLSMASFASADEPCGALPYDFRSGFEPSEAFAVQLPPVSTPLALTIDPRFSGLSLDEATIDLDGTYTGPPNVGVAAAGRVAQVDGSHWRIEGVKLALGGNPITVTATDMDGNTQSANVTVQRVAVDPNTLSFAADLPDGHAPRSAQFRFRVPANRTLVQIRLDVDGNGQFEQTSTQAAAVLSHRYVDPGWFSTAAQFTLDDGNAQTPLEITTLTAPILVANLERTRKTLCFVYGAMKQRLAASNIASATQALNPVIRPRFTTLWTNMGANLPTAIPALGDIAKGTIAPTFAELVVVRPDLAMPAENRGYRLQFDRASDGVWRIGGM